VSKGTVTITFDTDAVNAEDGFIDAAVVKVGNKEDGEPCVSSGQLLNLLVRTVGVLTVLSNTKVSEAYYDASMLSGMSAEAIRQALAKEFDITIYLESKPDNLN
jgi:hypothetical protein